MWKCRILIGLCIEAFLNGWNNKTEFVAATFSCLLMTFHYWLVTSLINVIYLFWFILILWGRTFYRIFNRCSVSLFFNSEKLWNVFSLFIIYLFYVFMYLVIYLFIYFLFIITIIYDYYQYYLYHFFWLHLLYNIC